MTAAKSLQVRTGFSSNGEQGGIWWRQGSASESYPCIDFDGVTLALDDACGKILLVLVRNLAAGNLKVGFFSLLASTCALSR